MIHETQLKFMIDAENLLVDCLYIFNSMENRTSHRREDGSLVSTYDLASKIEKLLNDRKGI